MTDTFFLISLTDLADFSLSSPESSATFVASVILFLLATRSQNPDLTVLGLRTDGAGDGVELMTSGVMRTRTDGRVASADGMRLAVDPVADPMADPVADPEEWTDSMMAEPVSLFSATSSSMWKRSPSSSSSS